MPRMRSPHLVGILKPPSAWIPLSDDQREEEMSEIELLSAHLRGEHSSDRVSGCPACARLPAVSAEEPVALGQNKAAPRGPITGRKCGCGCGAPVKRKFLPGHDAKLKSRLLKEARDGSGEAKRNLEEWGWSHFL